MKKLLLILIIASLYTCSSSDELSKEWKGLNYQDLLRRKGEPHDWRLGKRNQLAAVYYDTIQDTIPRETWYYMEDQITPITKVKIK